MQTLGRRERNKAEKRDRIVSAASRLFAQHGFAATTTQQVAADADVADGTLFRYAPTKVELLLMVTNERLAPLLDAGRQAAQARPPAEVVAAILDLVGPLAALADAEPDTVGPYLREVMFGTAGPHRTEALTLFDDLVHTIADLLRPHVAVGDLPPGLDLPEAARWVFSTLSSEVLRAVVGRGAPDTAASLKAHIRVLLRGLGVRLEGGQRP